MIVLALSPLSADAQTVNNTWVCSYRFFDAEKGGHVDRPGNFTTYSLVVSENGDALSARFTADGTQTSDDYECRIETSAGFLKMVFVKDLAGTESGKARSLKSGDLMLTLVKTTIAGKKTRYLFRAGKYSILPLSTVPQSRIYFEKIN